MHFNGMNGRLNNALLRLKVDMGLFVEDLLCKKSWKSLWDRMEDDDEEYVSWLFSEFVIIGKNFEVCCLSNSDLSKLLGRLET